MPLRMLRQIMCLRPPKLHNLSQERNRRGGHANVIFLLLCWGHALEGGTGVKDRQIQGRVPKRAIGGTPSLGPEELGAGEFCWKGLSHTGDGGICAVETLCSHTAFSYHPRATCLSVLFLRIGNLSL